ncbi:MAG: hypothetical protein V1659_05850 [Candidatus Woesearchaeota archaeon]
MPTTKTLYTCSICRADYETEQEAKKCEDRTPLRLPRGTICESVGDWGFLFLGDVASKEPEERTHGLRLTRCAYLVPKIGEDSSKNWRFRKQYVARYEITRRNVRPIVYPDGTIKLPSGNVFRVVSTEHFLAELTRELCTDDP